jgi:hypothetical protein
MNGHFETGRFLMGKYRQFFRRTAAILGTGLLGAVLILHARANLAIESSGLTAKTVEQYGAPVQADILREISDRAAPAILEYAPERVLVKFNSATSAERKRVLLGQIGAKSVKTYPIPAGLELVELPEGVEVGQAREYFSKLEEVEYSEPDFIYADAKKSS